MINSSSAPLLGAGSALRHRRCFPRLSPRRFPADRPDSAPASADDGLFSSSPAQPSRPPSRLSLEVSRGRIRPRSVSSSCRFKRDQQTLLGQGDIYGEPPGKTLLPSWPFAKPSSASSSNNSSADSDATEPPSYLPQWPRPRTNTADAQLESSLGDRGKCANRPTSAVRCQRDREQLVGENARTLEWSLDVQHESIRRVRVQLAAARNKTVKGIGGEDVPACLIEVSAEGHVEPGEDRGAKLIRCSGSLVPRFSRLHVNWLGRKGACPGEAVSPQPGRAKPGTPSWAILQSESDKGGKRAGPPKTIAQAVLATLAAVGNLFGMIVVELDAEDNGTGRLVQYYTDLGFSVVCHMKGYDVDMEAPAAKVVRHAPPEWIRGLVPNDFDPWGWLHPRPPVKGTQICDNSMHDAARAVLLAPDVPWNWSWGVAFPAGAKIDAKLSLNKGHRVCCDVFLKDRFGEELAVARGAVRIKQQALRVIWFGRSQSRAVHKSIRGRLAYKAGNKSSSEAANSTAATAVLGVLAVLARWFGTTTVHLTAVEDSSGKLLCHFRNLGFAELPDGPTVSAESGGPLLTSCKTLADKCCPPEWLPELPPDGGLSMLQRL